MSVLSQVSGTVDVVKTEFRWKVEQFSTKINLDVGTELRSPFFYSSNNNQRIPWFLSMYPGGEDEESKDYVGLYLDGCNDSSVKIVCSLAALNEKNKKVYRHELFQSNYWGYSDFLEKKLIVNGGKNMLADDTLTIFCEISIPGLLKHRHCDEETITVNNYFEELLENEKFSDVTITVGNKQILLHKCILSSISPVFQVMFDHDMRENNENKVNITDIKYKIAMEMFHYIYCRKVNNIEAIAEDLFKAADKYSIIGLKQMCEETMLENLSIDNVLKYLPLVTTYETTQLKSKVIEFILMHLNAVIEKPEYKQLNRECVDIILRAVATKEHQSKVKA